MSKLINDEVRSEYTFPHLYSQTYVDEKHTEDYLDWKYDEEIYNAQDRILGKLHKEFLDKLKALKEE